MNEDKIVETLFGYFIDEGGEQYGVPNFIGFMLGMNMAKIHPEWVMAVLADMPNQPDSRPLCDHIVSIVPLVIKDIDTE